MLLSVPGECESERYEKVVRESGMDWIIVRANWFMQKFSESFLLDPVLADDMVLPKVNAEEAFAEADDIAMQWWKP